MGIPESLITLRNSLDNVDEVIKDIGWFSDDKTLPIFKSYRHWLIETICSLQTEHFKKD